MNTYSRPHRDEASLLRAASAHAKQEREGRDKLVVDIAEIDARKLYRQAGYPSMVAYCVDELELSTKAALHRIHVARLAWRLPAILAALTDGRLHLTVVSLLAAHLNEDNVEGLVEAAGGKTKVEVRQLIAERFPRQDLFRSTVAPSSEPLLVATRVEPTDPCGSAAAPERRPDGVALTAPAESAPERRPDGVASVPMAPLPERFPLKLALTRETHEKLRYARELLGHQVPFGDLAEVLDRALDALICKLEKQKFAATDRPRATSVAKATGGRYVPAAVRRAVAKRDGRQCTFVGENGKRCPGRSPLEFDHIVEVARGGQSTVENVRLRCRAHNQYTAERTFGTEFMRRKREAGRSRMADRAMLAAGQ